MSFENEVRFERITDPVRAVRLSPTGHIPTLHADQPWLKEVRANGKLTFGPMGGFFVSTGTGTRAAYAGEWLVLHETTGVMEVLTNEQFVALYQPRVHDAEEDE